MTKTDEEIIQDVMSEIVAFASEIVDDPSSYFAEYYDFNQDKLVERSNEEYNRYRDIANKVVIEDQDPHTIVIRYVP